MNHLSFPTPFLRPASKPNPHIFLYSPEIKNMKFMEIKILVMLLGQEVVRN